MSHHIRSTKCLRHIIIFVLEGNFDIIEKVANSYLHP